MSESRGGALADDLVVYFNVLAQLAEQGLLISEVRGLVLGALADPYLTRDQEQELAKRVESGLFATEMLVASPEGLDEQSRLDLEWVCEDSQRAREHLLKVYDFLAVSFALKEVAGPAGIPHALREARTLLAAAVDSFDYTKDRTYASWIMDALATAGTD